MLIILHGSVLADYAHSLLSQRLREGGAFLVYAEKAQEVVEQYVVQFYEVLTNTRSGKMTFNQNFRASGFSEKQLAQAYSGTIASAERLEEKTGVTTYSGKALSSREYAEFQRQTGYLQVDYGEEVEFKDWYNQLITSREQRAFWDIVKTWNANLIVFGTVEIIPIGFYGGIHSSRAVISVRVVDTRKEPPCVLRSFAVVANAVDLSPEAAAQRAVAKIVEQVAEELSTVIPCYTYRKPVDLAAPLGAIGFAVLGVQASWSAKEFAEPVRRILEAGVAQYSEIAVFTRTDLEKVLAEQGLALTGIIANPVEVGRLAGVRYIFTGYITECDYQDQHYYIDFPILRYLRLTIRNMRVGLALSLLDAQTGQILWSEEKSRNALGFSILGLEFNMSLLDQFRHLASELLNSFYRSIVKASS
ncbi:MAG: hypothetical protein ABDI20_06545 [Candidatus Bipolaricaulaceae bacterium]